MYGIVGNRKGWNKKFVFETLNSFKISSSDIIISGGAEGIDTYAQEYAKQIGCTMYIFYPDMKKPSPKRYFDRNYEIAAHCETLIAFDKGSSCGSGTLNTINHAKRLGKKVFVIRGEN